MTAPRIALLRGINVGGHRKVPMAELRQLLNDVGLRDVSTYIQSGNVVFTTDVDDRAAEVLIGEGIERHFGFEVRVVVRPASMLPGLLERSLDLFPIADVTTHDKYVMVGFCSAAPNDSAIDTIDPNRSPGDKAVVEREHVHVSYASGQSTTKLTGDYLERMLGVSITMRNLNTLRKLIALTS